MRTATVILDGKEHEIKELKARKLTAWLQGLEAPVVEAMGFVASAMDTDTDDAEQLKTMVSEVTAILSSSIDQVLNLMVEFAPELKEAIDEAYTSEIVPAAVEVLKLALPFEREQLTDLWGRIQELGSLDK